MDNLKLQEALYVSEVKSPALAVALLLLLLVQLWFCVSDRVWPGRLTQALF